MWPQFLSDLQTVFFYCSPTARVPLLCNKIRQMVSKKNRNFTFKIVFFWGFKNDNILSSKSNTFTKSEISPQRKLGSLQNNDHKWLILYQTPRAITSVWHICTLIVICNRGYHDDVTRYFICNEWSLEFRKLRCNNLTCQWQEWSVRSGQ